MVILGLVVSAGLMANEQEIKTDSVQTVQVVDTEFNTVVIEGIQIKTYIKSGQALSDFNGSKIVVLKDSPTHQDLMRKASKHVTIIAVASLDEAQSLFDAKKVDALAYSSN